MLVLKMYIYIILIARTLFHFYSFAQHPLTAWRIFLTT